MFYIGKLYINWKKYNEALSNIKKAEDIFRINSSPWLNLTKHFNGLIIIEIANDEKNYTFKDRVIKLKSLYNHYLIKENNYLKSYISRILGDNYMKNNNYNKSILFLDKSVAFNPDYSKAYYRMGICYEKLNKTSKAIKNFVLSAELLKENQGVRDKLTIESIKYAQKLASLNKKTNLLPKWICDFKD